MPTFQKKNVLILVKTYPSLSTKYEELVCTAGITSDGKWIRLYPIPFRLIDYDKQYHKFQWVEVEVTRNYSDVRPESHRVNIDYLNPGQIIDTGKNWEERNRLILDNGLTVYTNLDLLIEQSKVDNTSLGILRPSKIIDFKATEVEREWDEKKIREILAMKTQQSLFGELAQDLKVVKKLPYKFQYLFEDETGKEHKLMIEDWEVGVLFWKMLEKYGSESIAVEKVREKYLTQFADTTKRDLYFFMGTTLAHHSSASPFIIIGVYCPPKRPTDHQLSMFDM